MKKLLIILLLTLFATSSIYDQYYDECKRIAQGMTLEQKIGQTIQADIEAISEKDKQITNPDQAISLNLGSVLIAGNAAPTTDGNLAKIPSYLEEEKVKDVYLKGTAENWKKLTDRFKDLGVEVTSSDNKKYKIKLLIGTDAVHGDQHTIGNILFPHNIGLSCSRNPNHFQNVGFWTKQGVKRSGFNYVFAPTVAVSHNPQWGRFYETMGQDDSFISQYASAFIKGLQDISNGKLNGALGTAKHFFGDGSTQYGANEGSASVLNFKNYISHNTQGYRGATSEDVGSVMVSYSAINYVPNSYNSYFLSSLLKDDIGFKGFTISDYDQVIRTEEMGLPRTFMNMTEDRGYALIMNAGVDMIMLSGRKSVVQSQLQRIIKEAKKVVEKSLLFEDRLTESVTRILQVKMAMGLISKTSGDEGKGAAKINVPESSSGNEYQDSLDAVHESLVVLKNTNTLPAKNLMDGIKYVVMVGEKIININRLTRIQLFRNFDDIGMQSGGWSVRWQGFRGNDYWSGQNKKSSNASSILDAVKQIQGKNNFTILYPNYTTLTNQVQIENERRDYVDKLKSIRKNMTSRNTLIIGVFGEDPYAESEGDVNIPYCKTSNQACLYNPYLNPYVPGNQPDSLALELTKFEKEVITEVRGSDKSIPLVSVILSGRPRLIDQIYSQSSAVIAAWLPGTSGGQGVMDAITGDYVVRAGGVTNKKNSLSMDWPRSMDSLNDFPIYSANGEIPKISDPQFSVGFGLSTETANIREQ